VTQECPARVGDLIALFDFDDDEELYLVIGFQPDDSYPCPFRMILLTSGRITWTPASYAGSGYDAKIVVVSHENAVTTQ